MVFSLPKILRIYFRYDRSNSSLLFTAAWQSIFELYGAIIPDGMPGAVQVLQTAGESLNWNPHLHSIVTSGAFLEDGAFQSLDYISQEKLTELFKHKVLNSMKEAELIGDETIELILSWQHSGFSAWVGEAILPEDADSRQFLARYTDRCPVANSRIEIHDDIVTYLTEKDEQTHEFDPVEFLARLSPHIPCAYESLVRYYGIYSSRHRGEAKKKQALQPTTTSNPPEALPIIPKSEARRAWAALIQKIYEVDPLICPKCGQKMVIKAFLHDPAEIKRLLENLEIPPFKPPDPVSRPPIPDDIWL
jgi:hypothetical protein